jgi:hypothetical protein
MASKNLAGLRISDYLGQPKGDNQIRQDASTSILFHVVTGNEINAEKWGIHVTRQYTSKELLAMARKVLRSGTALLKDGQYRYEIVGMGGVITDE